MSPLYIICRQVLPLLRAVFFFIVILSAYLLSILFYFIVLLLFQFSNELQFSFSFFNPHHIAFDFDVTFIGEN